MSPIEAAAKTDVGRVRSTNQDSYLVQSELGLFAVADGMGGHAGGEVASQLCMQMLLQHVRATPIFSETPSGAEFDSKVHLELGMAVNIASQKIYERALEEPSLRGMGTTATAALVKDGKVYFAHVGDSRLYLIRQKLIYQITHDHSLVSEQVRAGLITTEEAQAHHLRNVITRSVGYQEEEDVDSGYVDAEQGDIYLICSDGLHGKVSNREIYAACEQNGVSAVDPLLNLANNRGGEDNISVVAFRI